tara:strand:+ start:78 stop:803 length:726 start_codon:yes stop_codon:yes gene_type:complete
MYISGDNPCFSCIYHNPKKIRDIFINIEKKELYIQIIKDNKLEKLTKFLTKKELSLINKEDKRNSNNIIIRRDEYESSEISNIVTSKSSNSLIIIADQLTDQNNLGNIMRTSLLLGVDGIILPEHSSAPITSVTSSTSSGAIEIAKFHISKNLSRTIEVLKKKGYWIYSLDMRGEKIDRNFCFDKRSVLIIGSEGKGIRKNILDKSDFKISLHQETFKGIDSYNAANSLAMAAHHYKLNFS